MEALEVKNKVHSYVNVNSYGMIPTKLSILRENIAQIIQYCLQTNSFDSFQVL